MMVQIALLIPCCFMSKQENHSSDYTEHEKRERKDDMKEEATLRALIKLSQIKQSEFYI